MIKINLNKSSFKTLKELEDKYFYEIVNITKKGYKFEENSKITNIEQVFEKNSIIYKLHKNASKKNTLAYFYKFILDKKNNFDLIKRIIISPANELEKIVKNEIDPFIKTNSIKINKSNLNKILKLFAYDNLRGNFQGEFLSKELNVIVCPYCNREYTFTIKYFIIKYNKKAKKKTVVKTKLLFTFDHFLSKSKYPYLSISFYNLIPSCSICNTHFKGTEEFSVDSNIHPHIEGFNKEVTFTLNPKDSTFAEGNINKGKYDISFKNIDKYTKERNNNDIFKLDIIYREHKEYIDELIQKFYIYNNDYIKDLLSEKFLGENSTIKKIFDNENQLITTIFGNYMQENDLGKRPLAKLTKDIYEELKELRDKK